MKQGKIVYLKDSENKRWNDLRMIWTLIQEQDKKLMITT
jgi:hypothetical protein